MDELTVDITALGREGDGLAFIERPQGRVTLIVPGALPGDRLRVVVTDDSRPFLKSASIVEFISPSPQRRKPSCRHFGLCGGCMVQELTKDAYLDWKRSWIIDLLADAGLAAEVAPIVPVGEGTRRRAVFSARRTKKTVQLGYYRQKSHDLIDIGECPILVAAISDALPALRELVRPLLSRSGIARMTVIATIEGLDIAIDDAKDIEGAAEREQLAGLATRLGIARLTLNGEPLFERQRPHIHIDGFSVAPPPAAFLQATEPSQQAMIDKVLALVPEKADRVADLYSGLGTFALPLARRHKVLAAEADKAHLAALRRAADATAGLKTLETLLRDLRTMPLSALELRGVDAVVFDPPRAGAEQQARELAASSVADVIAVSCDPVSFLRDALILIDGGYNLLSVTPFDQFLYAPHLELIGHFRR